MAMMICYCIFTLHPSVVTSHRDTSVIVVPLWALKMNTLIWRAGFVSEAHTSAAAILGDELYAGGFESSPNGFFISCRHRRKSVACLSAPNCGYADLAPRRKIFGTQPHERTSCPDLGTCDMKHVI
jgi:hypothetical protein